MLHPLAVISQYKMFLFSEPENQGAVDDEYESHEDEKNPKGFEIKSLSVTAVDRLASGLPLHLPICGRGSNPSKP